MAKDNVGDMAWIDLSVNNAEQVKDFYQAVVGWKTEEVSMGDYNDYSMHNAKTNKAVTGICHSRGVNTDLPATWMPYFLVADIDDAVAKVKSQGGTLITPIKSMGGDDRYVVIKDPAGAACALYFKSSLQG